MAISKEGEPMSSTTELRLDFSELNQLSIPCGKCKTRVLLDCRDEGSRIPNECPSCGEEYGEGFRELLRTFRDVYRRLSGHQERRVEVRVSVR